MAFPQTIDVNSTAAPITFTVTSSGNWLTVIAGVPISFGVWQATTPTSVSVFVDASNLSAGQYNGTVTITALGVANSPQIVNVSLSVGAAPNVVVSPASLAFTSVAGATGSLTSNVAISLSAPSVLLDHFTASANGGAWLSVSPGSGGLPGNLNVVANPSGLAPGTYSGSVFVSVVGAANSPVTIPVSLSVTEAPILIATPGSLSFQYQSGGSPPPSQTIALSSNKSGAFSASVSGATWLLVTPSTGTTPATLTVSVDPSKLAPGSYMGTITLVPSGASAAAKTVLVNLAVSAAPTITASPSQLSFAYQIGGAIPPAQPVLISGSPASAFTASSSGGNWLSVSPASGTTPTTVNVSVSPIGLSPGTYTGTLGLKASGASNPSQSIPVTLLVGPPLPSIGAVLNGASFISNAFSPGSIVSIFGSGLGPTNGASLSVRSDDTVDSLLAGFRVLFDGHPAPLLFVQEGQINAIIPFEVAGEATTRMQIESGGVLYGFIDLPLKNASPALFTADSSGVGQGAILNQDGSANSKNNPAKKGSVIVLYGSGGGLLDRSIADGTITGVDLAHFAVAPTAYVDSLPAEIQYAGTAPGLVAGVIQVNLKLPDNVQSGNVPVILSVGDVSSQPGVTVFVQ